MFRDFNLKHGRCYSTNGFLFKRSLKEPSATKYLIDYSLKEHPFEPSWIGQKQKQYKEEWTAQVDFSLENSKLAPIFTREYIKDIESSYQRLTKNSIKIQSQKGSNHSIIDDELFDNIVFGIDQQISRQKRDWIEQETKLQQSSPLWRLLRLNKLTASCAGKLYKSIKKQSKSKLFRKISENEAMKHGVAFEPLAIAALEKSNDVKIKESGLWISLNKPYLGASPDGLIFKNDSLYSVVEVKCPFTARMQTIDYWIENNKTCLDKDRRLSRKHDYYFQIQMQMALAEVQYGLFGVFTGIDLFYEWIEFDQQLWNKMESKFERVWKDLNEWD